MDDKISPELARRMFADYFKGKATQRKVSIGTAWDNFDKRRQHESYSAILELAEYIEQLEVDDSLLAQLVRVATATGSNDGVFTPPMIDLSNGQEAMSDGFAFRCGYKSQFVSPRKWLDKWVGQLESELDFSPDGLV